MRYTFSAPTCGADGLDAVERKGFFATHRGLLELPQVWEEVLNFIDVPVEDDSAGTAESSAESFPMSHTINTAASTELAATDGAAAVGADGKNPARARRHAQLRTEAHARSKAHSQVLSLSMFLSHRSLFRLRLSSAAIIEFWSI